MQAVHGQEIGVAQVSGRVVVVVGGAAVHGRDNGVDSGDDLRRVVLGERGGSKVFACA